MAAATESTVVGTTWCRRSKRTRDKLSAAHTNSRDWANLTAGPAGLIAKCVLADDDVASYLRFRAVCVSWRRSTMSPHDHDIFDRRFNPRRWIMLPEEVLGTRLNRRDFLNVSTGDHIQVDIPELRQQIVFGRTSDGLILLCQKSNGAVRLLNPLTRQLTTLPNAASLPSSQDVVWKSNTGLRQLKVLKSVSAGLADSSSTLALHFRGYAVALAKTNVERWSRGEAYLFTTYTTLSFANRFYYFTREGLMAVDTTVAAGQSPQLMMVIKVDRGFFWSSQEMHLVDNDGELILVRRNYVHPNPMKYEVYLVDLDTGKLVPMIGLRGRALFVCNNGAGCGRSLSVYPGISSSINADTIYECRERDEGAQCQPRIDAYDLWRGDWVKKDFYASRGDNLDYLSRYIICRPGDSCSVKAVVAGPPKRKRKANPKLTVKQ